MEIVQEREKATKAFVNSLMVLITGFAMARTMSGLIINYVIDHFGLVGAQQGYMISVMNIGTTAAIVSTFLFRGTYKKTSMVTFSCIIMVVMMALTGLSVNFMMLLIVSLVFGVTLGWIDSYSNQNIVDADRENSPKNQSALQGFYGVGAIIAPIVISMMLLSQSWQGVYLILAPVILASFLVFIITSKVTEKYRSASGMEAKKLSVEEVKLFLKDRVSVYVLLANMTYYIMQYGLFAWLVRYMSVEHESEALGMVSITLMWVFTAIARFVAPRLPMDNMKIHAYGSVIAGLTLLLGILCKQPILMCVMVAVGAITTGNSLPTLINRCVVNYQGNSLLPTSSSFLVMQVIGMTLPPALGAIAVYSMQASMIVLAFGVLVSAFFGFLIMRLSKQAA